MTEQRPELSLSSRVEASEKIVTQLLGEGEEFGRTAPLHRATWGPTMA
jgi:hypothetical protein